jgi:hypothetical protein
MEEIEQMVGRSTWSDVTILMWVAIGLALVFVGVLIFDFLRRRKQDLRYQSRPGGLGRMLRRPFRRARVFREALREMRRQRARRGELNHQKRPRTRDDARRARTSLRHDGLN